MSRITRQEIDQVAELARLSLSEDEAAAMEHDLEAILGYVADLQALDTTGVVPTAHATLLATPVRKDEAQEPMDPERAVSNAPESVGTAFVVPKVIDEEGR